MYKGNDICKMIQRVPVLTEDLRWTRWIRTVLRASTFSVFKTVSNCNIVGLLHNPFSYVLVLHLASHFNVV